ncbi:MAG: hypothetical protein FJY82_03785 [Candidatus Aminicenantes bacterium]|nr:hypothetical protein [Candidatus Aminicenantes bacterium]
MDKRRILLPGLAAAALSAGLVFSQATSRPPAGNAVIPEDFRPADRWQASEAPDGRAELLFPVNVVRIYSDEHPPETIAPAKWVRTQLEIANRLFRFGDAEMAGYGPSRPAPCLQFRIIKFYDVHEREVSEILGLAFDTENVFGASASPNGSSYVGTRELRTLKVTDEEDHLTIYCVWSLKNPDEIRSEFGGESNVGFFDRAPTGPRRVLTRVTSVRAILGVVGGRQEGAFMSMVAHELGHYFGLPHAWERDLNAQRGIADLGDGPQGRVDSDPFSANVMDYDAGPRIVQYFSKSQLGYMYRFARDRASQFVRVIKTEGGGAVPPPPTGQPKAEIDRVWVDPPAPGGDVAVHVRFDVRGMRGQRGDAVAWFSWRSGEMLKDFDGQYRSMAGQVSVGVPITPGYDDTRYEDLVLTLPGGQLHLAAGQHPLSVVVGVFRGDAMLSVSPPAAFDYALRGAPPEGEGGGAPAAWITDLKVEPAAVHQSQTWVKVAAWMTIDNLLGREVVLQARYYFPDGTPLRDFDGAFRSAEGLAMAENKITPKYQRTNVTDMQVWIPVPQLHLAAGSFNVQARLTLVHAGRTLASAGTPVFSVTSVGTAVAKSAVIQNVWVTHNHLGGGQDGLLVHVNAVINGCQNESCSVVAWFHDAAANRLKDFDGQYTTQDGQASAAISVTPLYPNTTFTEIQIFMPYAQLHLAPGLHHLGARVGIFQGSTMLGKREELALFQVQWRSPLAALQDFVRSIAQRAMSASGGR